MCVQKITEKQMLPGACGQKISFMGKGKYWPLQNKPAQIPVPLKIPGGKKQEAAVKEATKYLL